MATVSSVSTIESLAVQLLEASIASFRLCKIPTRPALAPKGTKKIEIDDEGHRGRLSPQQVQQLLFLADTENLGPVALAQRFPISVTGVRRILANHAQCPRRVEPPVRGHNHRARGRPITLTGSTI